MRYSFLCIVTLFLSAAPIVQAKDIAPDISQTEFLPVARSSSGAFDLLKPLINARAQFKAGQFEESYKNYSTVFLHDPDNIDVVFGLAESALALGKNEIARKAFIRLENYTLTAKQSKNRMSGLVLSEVNAGISDNPETQLKQVITAIPSDYRLWNALGQEYDKQERWNDAWKAYQQAAKVGFSQAGLHNNLGMSLLAQKKYKGAVSHFKYAAKLSPEKRQFKNNHRFALLMSGNYTEALQNVSEGQAATLLGDAGYIAMQREEFTLAHTLLEKAIEVSPHYNQRAARNLEALEARQN